MKLYIFLILTILYPVPASAHVSLIDSSPQAGGVVTKPLENIQLIFEGDESVEDVTIFLISGDTTYELNNNISDNDSRVLVSIDEKLSAGVYQVAWQVTSEDGHHLSGSYQFEYAPSQTRTPLLIGIGIIILMSGVSSIFLWQRKKSSANLAA